jgi:hypothetical protein
MGVFLEQAILLVQEWCISVMVECLLLFIEGCSLRRS